MKRCVKCIMPETKPGIAFDENGVCNACTHAQLSQSVDWDARHEELVGLAEQTKKDKPHGYNCLVAVSGGKDSTFLALTAKEKLGLTPLLVCVEPYSVTDLGRKNLNNLSDLGFDIFVFKPNHKIMPPLLKRSLYENGNPGSAFEFMLYSVPMHIAINYGLKLAIWGENSVAEYGNKGKDLGSSANSQKSLCALSGLDSTHWIAESDNITAQDLLSYQHPSAGELDALGLQSIYMSHYIKFDSRVIGKLAISRGLSTRPLEELMGTGGYWYAEQLDDEMPIIGHLLKYFKFGYGRATDQACRDIRWGYITREEGLALAKKYDGHCHPDYITRYSDYIGISVDEFRRVAETFKNPNVEVDWEEIHNVSQCA